MEATAYQPRVAKASLSGRRPLQWPSVKVMREMEWSKYAEGEELKQLEKKYLRGKETLQGSYRDFEAFFVTQMLNAMQKTVQKNEMFHGGQTEDMFTERMNDELGKRLVEGGQGFGVAEMMEQQHLRSTYYKNPKMAQAIRDDFDARVQKNFKQTIEGVDKATDRLAKDGQELASEEINEEGAEPAPVENYEARKLELLAKEGLADSSMIEKAKSEKEKTLQERMAELQAASAYDFKKPRGFSLR